MLRINVVLEKEVAMYEDDPRILWDKYSNGEIFFKGFKIGDEIYNYVRYAKSLGDAKSCVESEVAFFKFNKKHVQTIFGHLDIRILGSQWKVMLICNYCGTDADGEAKISLRKITIYKRPPIGAKDLKIQLNGDENSWYKSPYVYKVRSKSAYCKKCGLTE